jgi:PIN domain nuclease of toxin-antitoxin system
LRLLLDTHALIWWVEDHPLLGAAARRAIKDFENEVIVSPVSAFEITTKYRLGKLPEAERLALDFDGERLKERFATLEITTRHAAMAGSMPIPHRDPFDRLLIAQALTENLTLVSNEALFDRFGVQRLW